MFENLNDQFKSNEENNNNNNNQTNKNNISNSDIDKDNEIFDEILKSFETEISNYNQLNEFWDDDLDLDLLLNSNNNIDNDSNNNDNDLLNWIVTDRNSKIDQLKYTTEYLQDQISFDYDILNNNVNHNDITESLMVDGNNENNNNNNNNNTNSKKKHQLLPTPPSSETSDLSNTINSQNDKINQNNQIKEISKLTTKKNKRIGISYPNKINYRIKNYIKLIDETNKDKIKRFSNDIKFLNNTLDINNKTVSSFVLINEKLYSIVSEKDWKLNFLIFTIPNNLNSVNSIFKFQKNLNLSLNLIDNWIYYDNINDQPHFSLKNSKLPLRYCNQIANFYEPFIVREKRKDGKKLTNDEIKERSIRRLKGKSKDDSLYQIEALCPYCPINLNLINKFDNYFYGRNDSDYLHHITKHHGVYSDGSEHPIPDLVVFDSKNKYYAHCYECKELIKIKNPLDNNDKLINNKFLGYLRHCLKHKNKCKNGGGVTRLERKQNIIENAEIKPLIYEDDYNNYDVHDI